MSNMAQVLQNAVYVTSGEEGITKYPGRKFT